MEDCVYRPLERLLTKRTTYWKSALGLDQWTIKIDHSRNGVDSSQQAGTKFYARTFAYWEYLEANIQFDMPLCHELFVTESEDEIDALIIHELMHVFVAEMREYSESDTNTVKHEERVVTSLTLAFRLYKKQRDDDTEKIIQKIKRITNSAKKPTKKKKKKK